MLGWDNQDKIAALQGELDSAEAHLAELGNQIARLQAERGKLSDHLTTLTRLQEISDFQELDWQTVAAQVARLTDEQRQLENASDVLLQLSHRLQQANNELAETEIALEAAQTGRAKIEQRQSDTQKQKELTNALIDAADTTPDTHTRLAQMRAEALGEHQLTVESCDNREQDMRKWLQDRIDAEQKRMERLTQKIIAAMTAFKQDYVLETSEFDISLDADQEYRNLLIQLNADDLPRFEARFKELLNVNTINEIANFNAQLAREQATIRERIEQINGSLTQIDYNPGRYIKLEAANSPDADIRDFRADLRACTEGAVGGAEDAQYSEQKFLQVKHIIDRFRGRDGLSEQDRRWTLKVTDVRNWFLFGASERWREDDVEYEHYSDSGGKSGGQKEKLAYTILAASLAYQFGLKWGERRSRSFRFVVIDEAFGRGSDESAAYGLQLFQQLNLQLLIVTPLQKIHIIEPYVGSVGFVSNTGGQDSQLRNLTIEEYREEKTRFAS